MSRKPLDQLRQRHPFTVVIDFDELSQLTHLADSLGITRHALGRRLLRLGLEHFRAEHSGSVQQQRQS